MAKRTTAAEATRTKTVQVGACGEPQMVALLCGLSIRCTCPGNTTSFNGGDVGECRRQISSFVDDLGGYARFGGIDCCGSCGDREDHCGHQNEHYGSCGFKRNRCYRGSGRM
uniref:Uncharacterized protein n=1 Tax=Romanomermis culicivorax TaxID=13658 RepID=A0A915KHS7_ROMCU